MRGYDPFAPEVMREPLPFYRELRASAAAHPLPQYDAWALPRFDDVWQVLNDRERFSIADGPIFARDRLLTPNDGPPACPVERPVRSFSMLDPPDHTRLRRAVLAPFLPGAVAEWADATRAHVRQLLDDLVPRGHFDAVADLGSPVATVATCRLLGFPAADHEQVVRLVNTSTRRDPDTPGLSDEGRAAQAALHDYVCGFVADARGHHAVVDQAAAFATVDGAPLTDLEIAVQLTTLMIGGVETLPKIVAGGILRLARHPEPRAWLAADPARVANGFEEIMRLDAVLQWVGRTVLVDTEVAGVPMRAGQRVFLLLVSANHDEREFPDPERFDVRRGFARTLVFGHGTHFCIGAHAARLQGRILFEELLARIPQYTVDEAGVERPPSEFQVGYTALPVCC
jgi:cytochrome P450